MQTTSQSYFSLKGTIEKILKEIGSAINSWETKIQIFKILSYKLVSENFIDYINSNYYFTYLLEEAKYENLPDQHEGILKHEKQVIEEIGYFIKPSDLFQNFTKNINEKTIVQKTIELFQRLENSTVENLKGIFELRSNEYYNWEKSLLPIFRIMQEFKIKESVDNLGAIYEIFLSSYFNVGGSKGGEYFTPADLAKLMAEIALIDYEGEVETIYDPTCGSGGLLLKLLAKDLNYLNDNIRVYGQEINRVSSGLCKLNLLINQVSYKKFNIATDDTLLNDRFANKQFNIVISNPPYSLKGVGKDNKQLINDPRFIGPGVLAPKKAADYAFILHALHHIKDDGIAVVLCYPGIFHRGGADLAIRKWLIDNNYVEGVIALPQKLFFNTTIGVTLLVLRKDRNQEGERKTDSIIFVNAQNEFTKSARKHDLSEENIENILHMYRLNVPGKAKLVKRKEIQENDYNMAVDCYVEINENKI